MQILVKSIIYPELKIKFNNDKTLDGVKRKLLDSNLAQSFGWTPKIKLPEAIKLTYQLIKK
jgi:nucleoside-diphosphate-sugar epimerase